MNVTKDGRSATLRPLQYHVGGTSRSMRPLVAPRRKHAIPALNFCSAHASHNCVSRPRPVLGQAARRPVLYGAPVGQVRVAQPKHSRFSGPRVEIAAYRRGNKLIVCAALAGVESTSSSVEKLLNQEITPEKELIVGQLDNGFRYVILPNKLPPKRFEAHLEIHAGSVDEGLPEQGVAHLVEHVTFLGSKRREGLLGTGARANAYTDFHHTVFHVHAPIKNVTSGSPMLPQVLEALEEIAFGPQFLPTRIEKERKAVLAEAQMMNTIEYRVDCQLLQYLHQENNLGCRFPIGKTDQVKTWTRDVLLSFWEKWYFPANATLYVVGDLDRDKEAVQALIAKTFGKVPRTLVANNGKNGNGTNGKKGSETPAPTEPRQRSTLRPPVEHLYGYGPLRPDEKPVPVSMFRHPLLQQFMLSVFCKLPIKSMKTMADLKQVFMLRILLSVFQFRINARYNEEDQSFNGIELDISDSGREGCAVCTLTITAEPKDWRSATSVAVQETRRLQRHGITTGEFERYRCAILRDSKQLAQQANKVPSLDTLNFVMESIACGHTVMGHGDAYEAMSEISEQITLQEVNAIARSVLCFASDYGSEREMLADAEAHPDIYSWPGPTRATSIVACVPAFITDTGASAAGAGAGPRRGQMGADGHIDADEIDLAELEKQAQAAEEFEVPEGAMRFDIEPSDIAAALADISLETVAPIDVHLPRHLLPPEEVQVLVDRYKPHFVPLDGKPASSATAPPDPHTGITQRKMSNGVLVNYRHTDNEPQACLLRIIFNGGRAAEKLEAGPDGFGAVVVGTRTMSETGTVGSWGREQVEAFCVSNLVNCALDADEESMMMDFHFPVGDGGVQAAFELLHLFLTSPRWEEGAMTRAKKMFIASLERTCKSLEGSTADRIMATMLGPGRPIRDPTAAEVEMLSLEGMRAMVMKLLVAGNMEVNVVGDFEAEELETTLLRYLGTIPPGNPPPEMVQPRAITFCEPLPGTRHQTWHLKDSDERACAYIAGPAPARWGTLGEFGPLQPLTAVNPPPAPLKFSASKEEAANHRLQRRSHPVFSSVCLMLLTEIINSRLFTTVRDSLGLTYDVSFEVTMFERMRSGWFSVHVTSHPDKIFDALNASVAVLREVQRVPITQRELARARTTLLTRHESDLKDNMYWLGLLTHIQNPLVPHKTIECLRDLKPMYEAVTVEDIRHAAKFLKLDDDSLFTCVGTSGKEAPPTPERPLQALPGLMDDDEDEYMDAMEDNADGTPNNPMAVFMAMMAASNMSMFAKAARDITKDGKAPPPPSGDQQK